MANNLRSADWLVERDEQLDEKEEQIRGELFSEIARLSKLSMFPPFNYEYGQNEDLRNVRGNFVNAVLSANKELVSAKSVSETFLDKFLKNVSTEIAEADMYKSRYKTPQKATEAYIKDNKNKKLSIDDFSV